MAATYTAEVLNSRVESRMLDFDPDANTEVAVTLSPSTSETSLSIAQFHRFRVGIMRSVGTGGITSASIYAQTSAAGAGSVAVVTITPTTADAVGDTVWMECDDAQVREVLSTATHIGVKITLATSTDECVVFFERAEPTFARTGLTANYIS